MQRAVARWVLLCCALGISTLAARPSAQLPSLEELMQQKLEHGQRLLEAVVLGDFVTVERYANELTLLSEASTWTPLRTPDYLRYAGDFRDAAARLQAAARDRDLDGVSGAYVELVTTCVQCHAHVKDARNAD